MSLVLGSGGIKDSGGPFYPLHLVVSMELWLPIWPVNLSDTGGLDWARPVVNSPCAVALPPLRQTPGLLLSWLPLCLFPWVGGEESISTRYCKWYVCEVSCYCLGCGEVIQWHFNRLSAFFPMALVLIYGIKTQPVRHWTCCLVVGQRGSELQQQNGNTHFLGCTYQS